MVKRKWSDDHESRCSSAKRTRRGTETELLDLSDELILRILSFLPVPDLTRCELLNHKIQSLSADSELWREKFYTTFVRRRAKKIPGLRSLDPSDRNRNALFYASRSAKWLQYTELNRPGTNWKQRYKIKSNWTRGLARTSETVISSSADSLLVRVCQAKIFTVDKQYGLRSWHRSRLLKSEALKCSGLPTSMAVCSRKDDLIILVGFADGRVEPFSSNNHGVISSVGEITLVKGSSISALAISWPYMLCVASDRSISFCVLSSRFEQQRETISSEVLTTLKADAEYGSIAISLRHVKTSIIASIAYTFNRFNTGWCLGLQELKLDHQGNLTNNRVASAVEELTKTSIPVQHKGQSFTQSGIVSRSTTTEPFILHPQFMRQPTSLSYSGCYILAGLPDNTLMVYTVASTDQSLSISSGRRLWGHTSAVAATEVTSNGKALSISARSNEMRYWELEEIVNSQTARTSTPIKSWNSVNSAIAARGDGLGLALNDLKRETELTRKWVGFDDEHAVILGERDSRQVLSCFDFA